MPNKECMHWRPEIPSEQRSALPIYGAFKGVSMQSSGCKAWLHCVLGLSVLDRDPTHLHLTSVCIPNPVCHTVNLHDPGFTIHM